MHVAYCEVLNMMMSRLKELLGSGDNTVTTETLVTSEDLSLKSHVPEKILDLKTKKLRTKEIREIKIKWMDK